MAKFLCPIDGHKPTSSIDSSGGLSSFVNGLTVGCRRTQCMNNSKGVCNFVAVTALEGSDVSCAAYFGLHPKDVIAAATRIRHAFVLNTYAEYVLGKPVLDVTSSDLLTLRSSRILYDEWSSSKPVQSTFDDLMSTLDILVSRL